MRFTPYLALASVLVLSACQSTPPQSTSAPAPVTQEPTRAQVVTGVGNSILESATGFSPLAASPRNKVAFTLHVTDTESIESWRVDWIDAKEQSVGHRDGTVTVPSSVEWDGLLSAKVPVPDGKYRARLAVRYSRETEEKAVFSNWVTVSTVVPSGKIVVTPAGFSRDPQAYGDHLTIQLNLDPGRNVVKNWRLAVLHPDGRKFADFISEDFPTNTIAWNGTGSNNNRLERGTTYRLLAEVLDIYGNRAELAADLPDTGPAPVVSLAQTEAVEDFSAVTLVIDGKLVSSIRIFFSAGSADLGLLDKKHRLLNEQGLDQLAMELKKFPNVRLKVVGHTNQVFWADKAKAAREQKDVLIPLSRKRAQSVVDALIKRGLNRGAFEVTGVGSNGALVPFRDLKNAWKNRRVEFIVQN